MKRGAEAQDSTQPTKKAKMSNFFNGKRALVTGAGQGLGREISISLAREGAHVIALSRTVQHLNTLKDEIEAINPGGCTIIACDLSKSSAAREAVQKAGVVDLLVNNAGMNKLAPFLEATDEDWDVVFNTNLKSAFAISQVVARGMVERGKGGAIVNVSSQASVVGLKDHVAYCASKGGMDQLTRTMALELGPHNIRVNSVNPTVVLTELGKEAWGKPEVGGPMKEKIPLKRFAEPHEVAEPVLFLLSDQASMINGVILPIDGGVLCSR